MIDQAFILCAGLGTRLRPHTLEHPKPLVKVGGQTLFERSVAHLRQAGVTKLVINTHYLAEQMQDAAKAVTDMQVYVSHEPDLLDTGGGIKNALHHFEGRDFYVLSGDGLWDGAPLNALSQTWDREAMDILMLLQPVESMKLTHGVGDYDLDSDGRAVRSLTRTGTHMFTSARINRGDIFDETPDSAFSYLDLMDRAQKARRLYGVENQQDWHHISTPDDLTAIRQHYENQS